MSEFSSAYDPGVQVSGDDVLSLHRNENLFIGPEWTVATAQRFVEQAAISSYPEATSLPLREALAEFYGVEPANVFVGNGSDEVLSDLLSLLRELTGVKVRVQWSGQVRPGEPQRWIADISRPDECHYQRQGRSGGE